MLLLPVQPHDGQPQPLCPIKLFADMDEECGQQCGDIDGLAPLLVASGMTVGLHVIMVRSSNRLYMILYFSFIVYHDSDQHSTSHL